ncbi:MAG TPA: OmpA family protein [Puia sp.]|nr:OmpA family protein [Puia sp.]
MRPIYCYFLILSLALVSCVSTGTYKSLQVEKSRTDSLYTWAMQTLKASQADNARLSKEKAGLKDSANDLNVQLAAVKQNNALLHKQLDNLSAISTAQAESIRKSIDNIGAKDLYLQQLRMALSSRDSANLAVLLEVKAAMGSFPDSVIGIKVGNGVVSLTVADNLLFGDDPSNVAVTDKGKTMLVRLSRVLRDQPGISCRVESFLDSAGMAADSVGDSWEVKARRAVAVVRALQVQYNVAPERLVAAGSGETGRGTRIVLVPPAEQLSEVLEKR